MDHKEAANIMGKNFIGPDELNSIKDKLGIDVSSLNVPEIQYSKEFLKTHANDYILISGVSSLSNNSPLTINNLRDKFGTDPDKYEPCFYNQDWYLKENFASSETLENKWYLIKKNVYEELRAMYPDSNVVEEKKIKLPSAILCTYAFFAYYFLNNEILWKDDFVWCSDTDANGDQIYVGRYEDNKKINKNGFNIHRHLKLKKNYSFIEVID